MVLPRREGSLNLSNAVLSIAAVLVVTLVSSTLQGVDAFQLLLPKPTSAATAGSNIKRIGCLYPFKQQAVVALSKRPGPQVRYMCTRRDTHMSSLLAQMLSLVCP